MTKHFILLFVLLGMAGCQCFQQQVDAPQATIEPARQAQPLQDRRYCLFDGVRPDLAHNCDLTYWLGYWAQQDQRAWQQRKVDMSKLGDGLEDKLHKILLCQAPDTPYQARLRAQLWAEQVLPSLSLELRQLLQVILYQPSQSQLEYESALAVMSRINSQHSNTIEQQNNTIRQQQDQLDQLLNIEASMLDLKEHPND